MAFKSEIHVAELASIRTGHTEGDIYYILDNGMLGDLPCKPGTFVKWHNNTWQIQPNEHYVLASAVEAIEEQIENIGQPLQWKGPATVAQLNAGIAGINPGWTYTLTDAGTLTDGSTAVEAGDEVAWTEDGKWFKVGSSINTDAIEQMIYKESMHVTNGGILINMPSIGSVVYVDPTNGDKYFLDPAKYPVAKATADGLNAVGVVADVDGRKVMVLHKDESGDLPFASKLLFKLSGFKIDGTGNSIAMQQYSSSSTAIDVGTYDDSSDPADSLEAFVEGFDAWLRANPTVEGALTYNWHCELMNDASGTPSAFLVIDSYTSYRQNSTPVKSGATATLYMWQWANQTTDRTTLLRNNGSSVYYAGWNKERLIEWFSEPTNASISPTDDPNGAGLLNKADFEGSSYPTVKAYYNNDYSEYMEAMMLKWPSTTGSQAAIYGTGKDVSNALASVVVKNLAGEDTYVFDGAKYSHDRTVTLDAGVTCDGFGADGWFVPDVVQAFRMFSKMKTDGSDPVNASMVAIGSTARSLYVARWLASRYTNSRAWNFTRVGYYSSNYFEFSYGFCSVSLLEF